MSKRNSYTIEFKREAVRLMRDGSKSVIQTAKDLGVSESALRRWEHELGDKPRNDGSEPISQEVLRLRHENRVLKMERDILKKAAAFFAKESL
jgi:transposase